ncbi:MAG: M20/M25/M40 family metallo-hydrolase [Rubrivivax sp.]|nr:M20/M25/M40 family metallo-hydrolase [Rubrivivax sp.]
MKRRDVLGAAALLACGTSRAQTAPAFAAEDLQHAELLRAAGLQDTQAWAFVKELCDTIGPRPAGSDNERQAAAWAQARLTALGLANARTEPTPMKAWVRGPASATLVAPVTEPLVMAALGNSIAAPPAGIEAEIAWYTDFAALKADTTERAKGRIVFIDQKMARARDGSGYGPAVAARSQGAVEAARRGALAVGIRSIGTDHERIAHTGAMRYEIGVPRIPAFAVSVPDADRLAALHAAGKTLRLQLKLDAKSDVETTTQNVIAEVPGTDLADEIVLVSGHLDSWDLGRGAVDDGAGCAIVSAAAALIARAGRRPRRTVRVVLFGNEENGFHGAMSYGDRYKAVVHQLVSESDFGAGRIWQMKSRVQPAALPLIEKMASLLAPLGVAWPEQGANEGGPGPDAALLMRRHKWPAIGLAQDGTAYFDVHHTVHDTLERIDPATLPQNVACWAVTAWLAAQAPLPFGPAPL